MPLGFGLAELITPEVRRQGGARALQLALRTEGGRRVAFSSGVLESPLFYVQAVRLNWFVDAANGPHVLALGQCFLGQGVLTVDGAQRRALWEPAARGRAVT